MSKKGEKPYLSLSVHQVVDSLLRAGDIDDRVYNQETMNLGSKIHAAFQKKQGKDYLSEYYLAETFERELGTLALNGRADGIITGGDYPIIDEIKSTVLPLSLFHEQQGPWHLGQAECYALMYLHEKNLERIGVRLTYIAQKKDDKMVLNYLYDKEDLEKKVYGYFDDYLKEYQVRLKEIELRNLSLKKLDFPFDHFRPGQRELSKYAYAVASKGGLLFSEAPTGIGKTMSTLFPTIKSLEVGNIDKVFYLTAKGTGRLSAYDALSRLYEKGLVARDSMLIAKDKICLKPGCACNPSECPYTVNYYGKLREAINEAMSSYHRFSPDYVKSLAIARTLCPFELQLDLSLYADFVLCDYNYFFDPMVHLERYFDETVDSKKYFCLVDEAHNLIDRGRSMYSASISLASLNIAKKSLKKRKGIDGIKRALTKIKKALEEADVFPEGLTPYDHPPTSLYKAIQSLKKANNDRQGKEEAAPLGEAFKDFYLEANKYLRIHDEFYGANYRCYCSKNGKDIVVSLDCLDPSPFLSDSFAKVKGAVVFSATLSPIDYYQTAILGASDKPFLLLPSPFPPENFKLLLAPKVSVRYKDRESTYQEVASYLQTFVSAKTGNYFLYFPSYDYLDKILPFLDFGEADVFIQEREMDEEAREEFLEHFQPSPEKTTIGLLVLGGAFSEGIDLVSDRLIGVSIVGIGLPMVSPSVDLIREYYDKKEHKGFEYAYMDPGMNKVMQAVGRLIRSEEDRGAALLIDDRYLREEYRSLFQRRWSRYEVVVSPEDLKEELQAFYKNER